MHLRNIVLLLMGLCLLTASCMQDSFKAMEDRRGRVEDSLLLGAEEFALQEIQKELLSAKDSDDYYLWFSTKNKVFFRTMSADSMMWGLNRIQDYLTSQAPRSNHKLQTLHLEWLNGMGVYDMFFNSRMERAMRYFDEALECIEESETMPSMHLLLLTNKADCHRQLGELDYSMETYLQALELAEQAIPDESIILSIKLGIAAVYTAIGDFKTGAPYWEDLDRKQSSLFPSERFIFLNNRGNDLYLQNRYAEALPYFLKAASLAQKDTLNLWNYYTALANLGEVYVCLGDVPAAEEALDKAEDFFHKAGFDIGLYYTETSRARVAMAQKNIPLAITLLEQAQTPQHMIPLAVVQRLRLQEDLYRKAGDAAKAYDTHYRYMAIADSIENATVRMRINAQGLRYQHDKKLEQQRHAIEHHKILNMLSWSMLALALLVILVLCIAIYVYRRKQVMNMLSLRGEILKLRMENTRNRISPHFIYNALTHEMLSQMKGAEVDFNNLTQLLRRGLAQVDNLVTTLKEELDFVSYYVDIEGKHLGDDFRFNIEIQGNVDMEKILLPSMVVQIFAENAIKHGLRKVNPRPDAMRHLTIIIRRDEGRFTHIEVVDNGMGMGADIIPTFKNGMKVVSQTIQFLNEHNKNKMLFGIRNLTDEAPFNTGCCQWLTIPDDYTYDL